MNIKLTSLLLVSVAIAQQANAISFELTGTTSFFFTSANLSNFGIAGGDPFRAVLTYDLSSEPVAGSGLYQGLPQAVPFLSLQVGNTVFSTGSGSSIDVGVVNGPYDLFAAQFHGREGIVQTPWGPEFDNAGGQFSLSFLDLSQRALSSTALPTEWKISDWPDEHFIQFIGFEGRQDVWYNLRVDVSSINRLPDMGSHVVPDHANTGWLLTFILVLFAAVIKSFRIPVFLGDRIVQPARSCAHGAAPERR